MVPSGPRFFICYSTFSRFPSALGAHTTSYMARCGAGYEPLKAAVPVCYMQFVRNNITLPPDAAGTIPTRPRVRDEPPAVSKKDMPIKFTGSRAEKHKVFREFEELSDESHPYNRYVVAASMAVFLIYFCILREENHLDQEMGRPLWERVPGLEERTLVGLIDYHKQKNEPTEEYEKRLKDIRAGLTSAKQAW